MNNISKCLGTLILILAVSPLMLLKSQVQSAFNIGDTIYRYSSTLKNETQRFSSINLQFIEFPCVDLFVVKKSSILNVDYELSAPDYREFYRLDATVNSFVGSYSTDPFLYSSNNLMVLKNAVPLVRSNRKDDFYEQANNEFYIVYKSDQLNRELRIWAEQNDFTELRVSGQLFSTHSYKHKDLFDNLDALIEGFTVQGEMNYNVNLIEGKKSKWESINIESSEPLKQYFDDVKIKYLSFYSYESLAEVARLTLSPVPSFYFHSNSPVGRHINCSHKGANVYVYPNPTFGNLNLKFTNSSEGMYTFSLSNIIGKSLWSTKIDLQRPNQELPIELPNISKGIYIYKVTDYTGKILQSRRLILVEP